MEPSRAPVLRRLLPPLLLLLLPLYPRTRAKYVRGNLSSKEDWVFLTRFCFLSDYGRLDFRFRYPEVVSEEGTRYLSCSSGRSFRSVRERWWYIALSKCGGDGLQLEYEMVLTNGKSFWTRHFSADEFGEQIWEEQCRMEAPAGRDAHSKNLFPPLPLNPRDFGDRCDLSPHLHPYLCPLLLLWMFFAVPVMALIANFGIPKWAREKIVNGIQLGIHLYAHGVFLAGKQVEETAVAAAVAPRGRVVTMAEPGAASPPPPARFSKAVDSGWDGPTPSYQPLVPQTAAPHTGFTEYFSMHTAGGPAPPV